MNRRKRKNSGSTLIMVVIALTLLTILGLAISAATVMNIQMKEINKEAQENFYDVETCMEHVKTGLVKMEHDASSEASNYVLTNYNSGVAVNMSTMFRTHYVASLENQLELATNTSQYDVSKISNMLSSISGAQLLTTQSDAQLVRNTVEHELILKNVHVAYTDTKRKMTTDIKTDIILKIPEFKVASASIYPEFTKYVTISEKTLNLADSSGVTLNGNVYAGFGETTNPTVENYQTGILLGGLDNSIDGDRIITRGDIKITKGGNTDILSDTVWARNYILSSPGANLTVKGNSYIEDDTQVNANDCTLTFEGEYNGYRSNHTFDASGNVSDDDAEAPLNAQYSSAVIVNGNKADITFKSSLSLAGRAFISLTKSVVNDTSSGLPAYGGLTNEVRDIMLGESLTIRQNQIAYFVPADFVTYDGAGKPILNTDSIYTGPSGKYAKYYGVDVSDYTTKVKKFYVQSLGNQPYYYLYFENDKAANDYYKAYFAANESKIQNYGKDININLGDNHSEVSHKVEIAGGNIMYRANSGSGSRLFNLDTTGMSAGDYISEKSFAYEYAYRQLSLLAANNAYASFIDTSKIELKNKTDMTIYSQIVSQGAIDTMTPGQVKSFERNVAGDDLKTVVAHPGESGTYVVTADDFRTTSGADVDMLLVICDGNVEVPTLDISKVYPCLIVARGNIQVADGMKLDNTVDNPRKVQSLLVNELNAPANDPDNNFLYYFNDLERALGSVTTDISLDEYILYENWIKNGE
ncbi:MAG: hypothetical protein PUB10_05905 [Clostridiales bacterium]|nr:hypothetical protein [Clostridiales bacterium]